MKDYPRAKAQQHISTGNWILTVLFTGFPVLGLVFSILFLFSKNKTKKNFAAAALIWHIIILAVFIGGYFITQKWWMPAFEKIFEPIKDLIETWTGWTLPTV